MRSIFRPSGLFTINCFSNYKKDNLLWTKEFKNIVVDEALIDVLATYFSGSWYIGLKGSNETPLAGWDAAGIGTDFTELTCYNEAARVLWDKGSITTKNPDNSATPAEFTIIDPGGTFYGCFMVNEDTKEATTGIMWCCSNVDTPQAVITGNILQVVYQITSQDAS